MKQWQKKILEYLNKDIAFGSRKALSDIDLENAAPVVLRLAHSYKKNLLLCVPTPALAAQVNAQLASYIREFSLKRQLLYLPQTVTGGSYLPENEAQRARTLHDCLDCKNSIIVGSINSLLAPVPGIKKVKDNELVLSVGMNIKFSKLIEKLVAMDYDDEFEVNTRGEFARRGGIVDIFSPAHDYPVRIEFWGDQVESMRRFSPDTQRSVAGENSYKLISRSSIDFDKEQNDMFDYSEELNWHNVLLFPEQCTIAVVADDEKAARLEQVCAGDDGLTLLFDAAADSSKNAQLPECFPAASHLSSKLPPDTEGAGNELLRQLVAGRVRQWLDTGYSLSLLTPDAKSIEYIECWCEEFSIPRKDICIAVSALSAGVVFPELKHVFLVEKELFSANRFSRKLSCESPEPAPHAAVVRNDVDNAFAIDLDEGDYAVHLTHGIGIFKGIKEVSGKGVKREVIVMEYRDGAALYLPVHQAGLLNRYTPSGKAKVTLHKIGSGSWVESKKRASRAIRDFALDLLRIQAMRESTQGVVFPEDDLEQRMFEDSFPFEDTEDQRKATAEIKASMHQPEPMDRLLCGDVGYGKTEVAIRAAFKVARSGRQVAVLAPTTVLAQQHFVSFSERFEPYPLVVEVISRFKTPKQQREVISRLKTGAIDVIIGTHRLIQKDVKFADIGLVIIDEEQRFGVKHKERLKQFRASVDILTMTATPIPRTLYLALAGARDMSTIISAPGERLPVATNVMHYDEKLICRAIELEISRSGQVFYIHNRVKSIEQCAEKLRTLMPTVKFAVAHGQMDADELETVMNSYVAGLIDVLVCTTIIESGLDVRNANTIIIERADRFGLAELYQLRGRVGRWNRQAYACLLLPKNAPISSDARKRISAIRRYAHLGAGFKLALRDLEIRGSGNLLGSEQSGHINALGFDLYCRLLSSTVSQLKGRGSTFLPAVDLALDFLVFAHVAPDKCTCAGFPPDYINVSRLRLEAYRRLDAACSFAELTELKEEIEDRYGAIPKAADNMFKIAEIKLCAAFNSYIKITVQGERVLFENSPRTYRRNGVIPTINKNNPPDVKLDQLLQIARLMEQKA